MMCILNSLFDNSNTCITAEFGSDASFVSSVCVFSFLLACLVMMCWKLDMLHQVLETEVNRTLLWGLMLIWPGVRLGFVFTIAISVRGCKVLYFFFNCLLFWLWAFLRILLHGKSASGHSFSCNCYYIRAQLVWGQYMKEGKHSIIVIKYQSIIGFG